MKRITTVLCTVALGGFLTMSSPVMAQEANRNNTELTDDDDDDTDYGWVGLIGLLGLLGLRKRDKVDRDYTTTTRPTGTTNR